VTALAFHSGLLRQETELLADDGTVHVLAVHRWHDEVDAADRAMLAECTGPVIDLGCGPGRLTSWLARRGVVVLGVDHSPTAVALANAGGGIALRRNIIDPLPGEGRWRTALLADGNIGIGGDPEGLLRRIKRILAPGARLVVELGAPGSGLHTGTARTRGGGTSSDWFEWAWVGADVIENLALRSGFLVHGGKAAHVGDGSDRRWFAVLES
jgi:SAM-dependent methyltransferase